MTVHDVRLGLALPAPNPGDGDVAAKQDLAQALPNLREAGAVRIVESVRARPVDGEVGNQGKANRFCKLDGFDNVDRLSDRNVFAAMDSIATTVPSKRCREGANNR